MPLDRRKNQRERIALKVRLPSGMIAQARDISARGMYLQLPLRTRIPPWIAVEVDLPRLGLRARALAEVIRTDRHGTSLGVALRLRRIRLVVLPSHHHV
ncbi:MAG: PilZ domain-containing protein [Pseudomonadota bacterium]